MNIFSSKNFLNIWEFISHANEETSSNLKEKKLRFIEKLLFAPTICNNLKVTGLLTKQSYILKIICLQNETEFLFNSQKTYIIFAEFHFT